MIYTSYLTDVKYSNTNQGIICWHWNVTGIDSHFSVGQWNGNVSQAKSLDPTFGLSLPFLPNVSLKTW